ncbi:unnamed protein product [Mytilus coruscus]|uniref:Peptidase A2 domain-containing protein n=1 Tax=Mytilus coruscus TaxID=42192 RepID=A0A6J8E6A5_MYTCO|nr:unnamed protein product [Mytilus coruscus]
MPPDKSEPRPTASSDIVIRRTIGKSLAVWGTVFQQNASMIVDTAAMITLVNEKLIREDIECSETVTQRGLGEQLVIGKIMRNTLLNIDGLEIRWDVCKAPLTDDVILGLDILDTLGAVINLSTPSLTVNNRVIPASFVTGSDDIATQQVCIKRTITVPPNSQMILRIDTHRGSEQEFILEPCPLASGVLVSHVVGKGKSCPVTILNDGNRYIPIKKGTPIGHLEEIDSIMEETSEENENQTPDVRRCIVETQTQVPTAPGLSQEESSSLPSHLTDLYERSIKHVISQDDKLKLKNRIPDDVPECDCYRAGLDPTTLPCHGCKYCLRAHEQWSRFGNDVDDVIPLATKSVIESIRTVSVIAENDKDMSTDQEPPALAEDCHSDPSSNLDDTLPYADGDPCSNWAPEYPSEQLKIFQQEDPDLAPILKWMEEDVEPTQAELRLQSRATRSLWLCRPCFIMFNNVPYNKFIGCPARQSLCLVVPSELKGEVLKNCHDTKTSGHLGQKKNAR